MKGSSREIATSHSQKISMQGIPKSLLKSAKRSYRRTLVPLAKDLKIGLLRIFERELDTVYDEEFANLPWRSKPYADAFCEAILREFPADSVVDIGCGTADFLSAFHRKKLKILGIDGSRANYRHRLIPEEHFMVHDIRKPISLPEKHGICLCLEVAEHLPKKHADGLVDLLTSASDIVVFTAAPIGQGGKDHLNEQPASWWIEKFERRGFDLLSQETENIKNSLKMIALDDDILKRGLDIYIANMMAFGKSDQ